MVEFTSAEIFRKNSVEKIGMKAISWEVKTRINFWAGIQRKYIEAWLGCEFCMDATFWERLGLWGETLGNVRYSPSKFSWWLLALGYWGLFSWENLNEDTFLGRNPTWERESLENDASPMFTTTNVWWIPSWSGNFHRRSKNSMRNRVLSLPSAHFTKKLRLFRPANMRVMPALVKAESFSFWILVA